MLSGNRTDGSIRLTVARSIGHDPEPPNSNLEQSTSQ